MGWLREPCATSMGKIHFKTQAKTQEFVLQEMVRKTSMHKFAFRIVSRWGTLPLKVAESNVEEDILDCWLYITNSLPSLIPTDIVDKKKERRKWIVEYLAQLAVPQTGKLPEENEEEVEKGEGREERKEEEEGEEREGEEGREDVEVGRTSLDSVTDSEYARLSHDTSLLQGLIEEEEESEYESDGESETAVSFEEGLDEHKRQGLMQRLKKKFKKENVDHSGDSDDVSTPDRKGKQSFKQIHAAGVRERTVLSCAVVTAIALIIRFVNFEIFVFLIVLLNGAVTYFYVNRRKIMSGMTKKSLHRRRGEFRSWLGQYLPGHKKELH